MTRRILIALALAFGLSTFSLNAQACPAIEGEEVNDEYVQAFIHAARKVGAPCPVSFTDDGVTALIQYVPDDQSLSEWKSMMAANIVYMGDRDMVHEMPLLSAKTIERIKERGGHVKEIGKGQNMFGPMYLLRYTRKEDGAPEQALAVVRPVGPDKAAIIHWHKRDAEVTDADIKLFRTINAFDEKPKPAKVEAEAKEEDAEETKQAPQAATEPAAAPVKEPAKETAKETDVKKTEPTPDPVDVKE